MNTNRTLTGGQAKSDFKVSVKSELVRRGKTVVWLAGSVGRSRNAVSRAINQGEFPKVQTLIKNRLAL
jgi:hypothetical protein